MSTEKSNGEKKLPALPVTLEGWDKLRKPTAQPRLVDEVERVFRAAIANPEYNGQLVALLEATDNKNAREGSLGADRIKASDICRAQANEMKATMVSEAKLQIIANKMSSVLRRYQGASRVERQKLAG